MEAGKLDLNWQGPSGKKQTAAGPSSGAPCALIGPDMPLKQLAMWQLHDLDLANTSYPSLSNPGNDTGQVASNLGIKA